MKEMIAHSAGFFNVGIYILSIFLAIVIHQELNFPTRVKVLLGIRISKPVKFLDCFPCFSFWISCALIAIAYAFSNQVFFLTPMAVYISSIIIERNK